MRLIKQGIGISASQLFEKIISFAIVIIASRHFGSEGVGEFFYYFSLVSLFIPLMDMGFDKLLLQRWYDRTDGERKQLISELVCLKFVSGILALALVLLVDRLWRAQSNPQAVTACFVAIFAEQFGRFLRKPAHAEGRVWPDILIPILCRIVTVGLLVSLLKQIRQAYQIAYFYALANCLGAVISHVSLGTYHTLKLAFPARANLWSLVRAGIPFSLSHLFVMLSLFADSVILGHYSLEDVGLYNAAYRVILVAVGLSGGACYALFPQLARCRASNDTQQADRLLFSAIKLHLLLFGSIAMGGLVAGDKLMTALYGDAFMGSALPFRILCGIILVSSLNNVLGHSFEAKGKQTLAMTIALAAATFNVVTNLIFIPFYGMMAAAVTTVCTELIVLGAYATSLYRNRATLSVPQGWLRIAGFLLMTGGLFCLMRHLNIWIMIPACAGLFLGLLVPFHRYWLPNLGWPGMQTASTEERTVREGQS